MVQQDIAVSPDQPCDQIDIDRPEYCIGIDPMRMHHLIDDQIEEIGKKGQHQHMGCHESDIVLIDALKQGRDQGRNDNCHIDKKDAAHMAPAEDKVDHHKGVLAQQSKAQKRHGIDKRKQ